MTALTNTKPHFNASAIESSSLPKVAEDSKVPSKQDLAKQILENGQKVAKKKGLSVKVSILNNNNTSEATYSNTGFAKHFASLKMQNPEVAKKIKCWVERDVFCVPESTLWRSLIHASTEIFSDVYFACKRELDKNQSSCKNAILQPLFSQLPSLYITLKALIHMQCRDIDQGVENELNSQSNNENCNKPADNSPLYLSGIKNKLTSFSEAKRHLQNSSVEKPLEKLIGLCQWCITMLEKNVEFGNKSISDIALDLKLPSSSFPLKELSSFLANLNNLLSFEMSCAKSSFPKEDDVLLFCGEMSKIENAVSIYLDSKSIPTMNEDVSCQLLKQIAFKVAQGEKTLYNVQTPFGLNMAQGMDLYHYAGYISTVASMAILKTLLKSSSGFLISLKAAKNGCFNLIVNNDQISIPASSWTLNFPCPESDSALIEQLDEQVFVHINKSWNDLSTILKIFWAAADRVCSSIEPPYPHIKYRDFCTLVSALDNLWTTLNTFYSNLADSLGKTKTLLSEFSSIASTDSMHHIDLNVKVLEMILEQRKDLPWLKDFNKTLQDFLKHLHIEDISKVQEDVNVKKSKKKKKKKSTKKASENKQEITPEASQKSCMDGKKEEQVPVKEATALQVVPSTPPKVTSSSTKPLARSLDKTNKDLIVPKQKETKPQVKVSLLDSAKKLFGVAYKELRDPRKLTDYLLQMNYTLLRKSRHDIFIGPNKDKVVFPDHTGKELKMGLLVGLLKDVEVNANKQSQLPANKTTL